MPTWANSALSQASIIMLMDCGCKAAGSTWKRVLGKCLPQKGALTFQIERCRQIRTVLSSSWGSELVPFTLHYGLFSSSTRHQAQSSWAFTCSCLPSYLISTYPPPPVQVGAFIYLSFRLLWILVMTLRILVESCRVFRCILGTLVVMRALEHVSSGDAARGPSPSTACGVLVARPGMEPAFPELQGGF